MRLWAKTSFSALPFSKNSQLQEGEEIQMLPQLRSLLDPEVGPVPLPLAPGPHL